MSIFYRWIYLPNYSGIRTGVRPQGEPRLFREWSLQGSYEPPFAPVLAKPAIWHELDIKGKLCTSTDAYAGQITANFLYSYIAILQSTKSDVLQHCDKYQSNQDVGLPSGSDIFDLLSKCNLWSADISDISTKEFHPFGMIVFWKFIWFSRAQSSLI